VHTAAWDNSIDLAGKTVGVIGNGSSAVQVIPAVYDRTKIPMDSVTLDTLC
jgi:cation diffusion facilitator CzcD-associated flavoprotein CzcO